MAGKGTGSGGRGSPRQPLSQKRPKAHAIKRSGRALLAKSSAKLKSGIGGPPPKGKIPADGRTQLTKSTHSPAKQRKAPAKGRSTKRPANLPAHAAEIFRRLSGAYPDAHCELDHRSPWELIVATILSAQCTDKRVNMVTPSLFAAYATPTALAAARPVDVEEIIKSTGFFRSKTKSLLGMASAVVNLFGGDIPPRMDDLVTLPGVGRKTANVVLGNAFNINSGVVVDTHVSRLSALLGLTTETDPVKIEKALIPLFQPEQWTMLSHLLIWHGRRVCDARKPRCGDCVLADVCPSARVA